MGDIAHRAAYFAFDRFPSTKGSGVHIRHMASALFDHFDGGLLGVLGGGGLPRYQREGPVEIARFDEPVPNLIDRAEAYSAWVAAHLLPHLPTLELCHVRDPWGALPVVAAAGRRYRVVYEVNGLPSIEMTHTWPAAAPASLAKISELARALRVLLEYPAAAQTMGRSAQQRILAGLTWADTRSRLVEVYQATTR